MQAQKALRRRAAKAPSDEAGDVRVPGPGESDRVHGRCLCGAVQLEIGYPARWAWHDHTQASRIAHGAAYATYVGCWRKRFRVVEGEDEISHYEHAATRTRRSFCRVCGTPLFYVRGHSHYMVNVPRSLFAHRTGREPRYHVGIDQMRDWTYAGDAAIDAYADIAKVPRALAQRA